MGVYTYLIDVKIKSNLVELLAYMAERYSTTVDSLIEEAIYEYYSEERRAIWAK